MTSQATSAWNSLFQQNNKSIDSSKSFGILSELLARYGETHRAYHNLSHIIDCLPILQEFITSSKYNIHEFEIIFAWWCHDGIYDTRGKNNEEQSAELAVKFMVDLGIPKISQKLVSDLILATKHDKILETHDAQILIDIDLSILGASVKRFDEYEINIRKEYHWVSDEDFRNGRATILKSFLDRENIFSTPMGKERYQKQAETNIKRSISRLIEHI